MNYDKDKEASTYENAMRKSILQNIYVKYKNEKCPTKIGYVIGRYNVCNSSYEYLGEYGFSQILKIALVHTTPPKITKEHKAIEPICKGSKIMISKVFYHELSSAAQATTTITGLTSPNHYEILSMVTNNI
jgi:hypothetical protein